MILVNKNSIPCEENLNLAILKQRYNPVADVATVNGVPVAGAWEEIEINDGDRIILIERAAAASKAEFERIAAENITPSVFYRLERAVVGIAGLGGLGSTVALALARVGVSSLVIADYDVVEPTNLNRQQYFIDQIGKFKVDATKENIRRINPYITVEIHRTRLTCKNIPEIFAEADVVAECFDRAEEKQMLVETVLSKMQETVVVSVSGLAGYGNSNAIKTKRIWARHILVGDGETVAQPGRGLMAPRVGLAAHHQANAIVEVIVDKLKK